MRLVRAVVVVSLVMAQQIGADYYLLAVDKIQLGEHVARRIARIDDHDFALPRTPFRAQIGQEFFSFVALLFGDSLENGF